MQKGKPHSKTDLQPGQIVPFLRSVVRSGEELHHSDIDSIEAALKPLLEK